MPALAEEKEQRAQFGRAGDPGTHQHCWHGTGPEEAGGQQEAAGPSLGRAPDRARQALHPLADGHLYLFALSSF